VSCDTLRLEAWSRISLAAPIHLAKFSTARNHDTPQNAQARTLRTCGRRLPLQAVPRDILKSFSTYERAITMQGSSHATLSVIGFGAVIVVADSLNAPVFGDATPIVPVLPLLSMKTVTIQP
jgi:hypothetical protein